MNATVTRKLAAIFAADMVGFSRLMCVDEEGTLAALQAHLGQIIEPAIAEHRGRIFKTTGDGVLAEFASVVDAVRCALVVQAQVNERNADEPEDRRIAFRIGVNLGDVMVAGDDIYGDGVNVAARLQQLAETGGILISGTVYDQVRDKLDAAFVDLGEKTVKNIARPVRVWRVAAPSAEKPAAAGAIPVALALPDKPSIVVLPFENMSGDPEQAYFSDGMTEDIITDLSKISGLFVIARNSAFAYRGKAIDVRRVAKELGVRHVLEGSVRKAGNRVRITAQLIDGLDGGHLWAERFDRELTDIFAVQDEVTQHIVKALSLKLTRDERQRLARKGTENMEAYDWFLKGRDLWWRMNRATNAEAKPMFERAVALDDGFAAAYAGLAQCHNIEYINGWSASPEASHRLARDLVMKAVSLDASNALAQTVLGSVLLWAKEHDQAIAAATRAIELEPNYAYGCAMLGHILDYVGRSAESLELLDKAMRLDPLYPDLYLHFAGLAYFALGRYDEAVSVLQQRIKRNPGTDISRVLLAACYGHMGKAEAARDEWSQALKLNPAFSLERRKRILPYKNPEDYERIPEGLRKAGLID
jgi:adenylate cyclase